MIAALGDDLRDAARRLRRAPGFTVMVVITLAVATAVNVIAFTAYDAMALHPLAVRAPEMLRRPVRVLASGTTGDIQHSFSLDEVADLRGSVGAPVVGVTEPIAVSERMKGRMTASFALPGLFELLGVSAVQGHLIVSAQSRRIPSAVMSHQLWTTRFHGDPRIVGKRLVVNGTLVRIAGVTAADFLGTGASPVVADLWLPAESMPKVLGAGDSRITRPFHVLVRLSSTVREGEVAEAMTRIAHLWRPDAATNDYATAIELRPATLIYAADTVQFRGTAAGILGMFAIVLLVACVNIGNMMQSRTESRRREIAIRLSVGAGKARLMWQLLGESLLLALCGGVLGIVMGAVVVRLSWRWILRWAASQNMLEGFTLAIDPSVDWRVVLYGLTLSAVAALACGLGVSLGAMRLSPGHVLKSGRIAVGRGRRAPLRRMLLGAQVTASVVLLLLAGLFAAGVARGRVQEPGYDTKHIVAISVPGATERLADLADSLALNSDVSAVAFASPPPMLGSSAAPYLFDGEDEAPRGRKSPFAVISSAYFDVLRVPFIEGRPFTLDEQTSSERVAIISEGMARMMYHDESALGHEIRLDVASSGRFGESYRVVGVARDVRTRFLSKPDQTFIYLPVWASPLGKPRIASLLVRTSGTTSDASAAIRKTLSRAAPVFAAQATIVSLAEGPQQLQLLLTMLPLVVATTLGAIALVLALGGIFGIMAQAVGTRRGELGVRAAVGAPPERLMLLVLREEMRPVLVGALIGVALALMLSRALVLLADVPDAPDLLFGISPFDPRVLGAVLLTLGTGAFAAALPSLRRIVSLSPSRALAGDH